MVLTRPPRTRSCTRSWTADAVVAWSALLALAAASAVGTHAANVEWSSRPGHVSDPLEIMGYVLPILASPMWLLPSFALAVEATRRARRARRGGARDVRGLGRTAASWTAGTAALAAAGSYLVGEVRIGTHSGQALVLLVVALLAAAAPLGAALLTGRSPGPGGRRPASPASC